MSDFLSSSFWNQRYEDGSTGWDLGKVSPPIKAYVDQLEDKTLKILIPGAGNGHEAAYLHSCGFTNVHVLDFAPLAIESFLKNNPSFPSDHTHASDFFEFAGNFDLIFEQTLFCAIDPSLRFRYAEKASSLLRKGGKLVGVLFNRTFESGPPFGGSKMEYIETFAPHFTTVSMHECYNSIEPRMGSELFILLEK